MATTAQAQREFKSAKATGAAYRQILMGLQGMHADALADDEVDTVSGQILIEVVEDEIKRVTSVIREMEITAGQVAARNPEVMR